MSTIVHAAEPAASNPFKGTCVHTEDSRNMTASIACIDRLKAAHPGIFAKYRAVPIVTGSVLEGYVIIDKKLATLSGLTKGATVQEANGKPVTAPISD